MTTTELRNCAFNVVFGAVLVLNVVTALLDSSLRSFSVYHFGVAYYFETHRMLIGFAYVATFVLMSCGILADLISFQRIRVVPLMLVQLTTIFFYFSALGNGGLLSPFFVLYVPVTLTFLFLVPEHYTLALSTKTVVTWLFVVWAVVPVVWFLVSGHSTIYFWHDATFRGLAQSRTDYGLYTSLAILLLVTSGSRWALAIGIPLLYGIFLSESRASVVALSSCVSWHYASRLKGYARYLIPSGIIILGMAYLAGLQSFGVRNTFVELDNRRAMIFSLFLDFIGKNFFLGSGNYYRVMLADGTEVEAHNALLQSLASFGFFATLSFLILIAYFLVTNRGSGRVFLVYALIFGMFHPGIDFLMFNATTILLFGCAMLMSQCSSRFSSGGLQPLIPVERTHT